MEASRSLIADRIAARNTAAASIRNLRTYWFKELDAEQRKRMRKVMQHGCQHFLTDVPPKPTKENLYGEMIENFRYSRSSWTNMASDEYYTACGWDDYYADMRREAFRHARDIFRAWQTLPA